MFRVSRSGMNLVSNSRVNKGSSKVRTLQKSFLPERVIPFWNKLPSEIKSSASVLTFKIKLDEFKKRNVSGTNVGQFWEVGNEVLSRIEGINYIENKVKHNQYLWFNPYVAKKKFVNLYSTGKYQ